MNISCFLFRFSVVPIILLQLFLVRNLTSGINPENSRALPVQLSPLGQYFDVSALDVRRAHGAAFYQDLQFRYGMAGPVGKCPVGGKFVKLTEHVGETDKLIFELHGVGGYSRPKGKKDDMLDCPTNRALALAWDVGSKDCFIMAGYQEFPNVSFVTRDYRFFYFTPYLRSDWKTGCFTYILDGAQFGLMRGGKCEPVQIRVIPNRTFSNLNECMDALFGLSQHDTTADVLGSFDVDDKRCYSTSVVPDCLLKSKMHSFSVLSSPANHLKLQCFAGDVYLESACEPNGQYSKGQKTTIKCGPNYKWVEIQEECQVPCKPGDISDIGGSCVLDSGYCGNGSKTVSICTAEGKWKTTTQPCTVPCLCIEGQEGTKGQCIPEQGKFCGKGMENVEICRANNWSTKKVPCEVPCNCTHGEVNEGPCTRADGWNCGEGFQVVRQCDRNIVKTSQKKCMFSKPCQCNSDFPEEHGPCSLEAGNYCGPQISTIKFCSKGFFEEKQDKNVCPLIPCVCNNNEVRYGVCDPQSDKRCETRGTKLQEVCRENQFRPLPNNLPCEIHLPDSCRCTTNHKPQRQMCIVTEKICGTGKQKVEQCMNNVLVESEIPCEVSCSCDKDMAGICVFGDGYKCGELGKMKLHRCKDGKYVSPPDEVPCTIVCPGICTNSETPCIANNGKCGDGKKTVTTCSESKMKVTTNECTVPCTCNSGDLISTRCIPKNLQTLCGAGLQYRQECSQNMWGDVTTTHCDVECQCTNADEGMNPTCRADDQNSSCGAGKHMLTQCEHGRIAEGWTPCTIACTPAPGGGGGSGGATEDEAPTRGAGFTALIACGAIGGAMLLSAAGYGVYKYFKKSPPTNSGVDEHFDTDHRASEEEGVEEYVAVDADAAVWKGVGDVEGAELNQNDEKFWE